MNPEARYDALNCAALAIDEAGSGRPLQAMTAWLAAGTAAVRAFDAGSPQALALAAVVADSAPSLAGEPWRPALWRALGAASLASLLAESGDTGPADDTLMDAAGFAAGLPCRDSIAVIATAIWDASRSEVPA